ncbi:MAG: hypothetical protein H9Q66_05115 [Spiroplasma ixodetis]|nr:hypothetical protein [Spiroplasma ixodetis]
MNKQELGKHIDNFVKLNPKKNKYLKINQELNKSFFVIKSNFKANIKNIFASNYDDVFYSKNLKLSGKKWIEILLSSKNITEYNKLIRDVFPYCKTLKLGKKIFKDLFFWFDKNTQNSIIEVSEVHFDDQIKKQLEKIRKFLDEEEWSIYFFEIQKLMHEQIIKFLLWENKPLKFNHYGNLLFRKMIFDLTQERVDKYLNFVQKVNIYRNTISKVSPINKVTNDNWNKMNNFSKQSLAKELYYELIEFIDVINLLLNEKSK